MKRCADKRTGGTDIYVRRYVSALNVNGRDAFAWITVKDTEEDLRIYSVELMDEKKLRGTLSMGTETSEPSTPSGRSFDDIIARLNAPVKKQSFLYMSAADIARGFVAIANGQESFSF